MITIRADLYPQAQRSESLPVKLETYVKDSPERSIVQNSEVTGEHGRWVERSRTSQIKYDNTR